MSWTLRWPGRLNFVVFMLNMLTYDIQAQFATGENRQLCFGLHSRQMDAAIHLNGQRASVVNLKALIIYLFAN